MSAQAQAQAPGLGVELDCIDYATISLDVTPGESNDHQLQCTVTNSGSVTETIELEANVDGNDFKVDIKGESSYTIEAGGDESFVVDFSAPSRLQVSFENYEINATVVSIGIDPIPSPDVTMLGVADSIAGKVESLPYTKFTLDVLIYLKKVGLLKSLKVLLIK